MRASNEILTITRGFDPDSYHTVAPIFKGKNRTGAMWAYATATVLVYTHNKLSPEATKAISQINSFKELGEDWDSYDAAKVSTDAIEDAIDFVKLLDRRGEEIYYIGPGSNGEVLLELKNGRKSIELIFYPNKKRKFAGFEGGEPKFQGSITMPVLTSLLVWLNQ